MSKKQELANLIGLLIPYADALRELRDDVAYLGSIESTRTEAEARIKALIAQESALKSSIREVQASVATSEARIAAAQAEANKIISDAKVRAAGEADKITARANEAVKVHMTEIDSAKLALAIIMKDISERSREYDRISAEIEMLRKKIA